GAAGTLAGLPSWRHGESQSVVLPISAGVVGEYLWRSEVWAPHCRSGLGVERRLGKAQVGGSIPPCGSIRRPCLPWRGVPVHQGGPVPFHFAKCRDVTWRARRPVAAS